MGRQVRFYMTSEDCAAFVAHLKTDGDTRIVPLRFPQTEVPLLAPAEVRCGTTPAGYFVVRMEDAARLVVTPSAAVSTLDIFGSPAIQWRASAEDEGGLTQGRLFFDPKVLDGTILKRKDEQFIAWADGILAWIRKHYAKRTDLSAYVGPDAAKWHANGGKLLT